MNLPHLAPPSLPHASARIPLFAAGVVLVQMVAAERFGIARDELYHLACADHLAWGYVEHPPLSIALLAAWKAVAGEGLLALRIPGAMLSGAAAILAALLAREMGGWRLAQALAAIAVGLMPGVLALGCFYSMGAINIAIWLAAALIAARLLRGGTPRLWLLLGAVIGLGLLNKYSLALLPLSLAIGLLLSPQRRLLRDRWAWIGAAAATALVLPNLAWQAGHAWPTLEFIRNARAGLPAGLPAAAFWKDGVLVMHPLATPLALLGLVALLWGKRLRTFRPLGVAVVVSAVLVFLSRGNPCVMVAIWPLALAAGAVAGEGWISRYGPGARRFGGGIYALLLLVGGLTLAPVAIPLVPAKDLLVCQRILGVSPAAKGAGWLDVSSCPAPDSIGWRKFAGDVFAVVTGLSGADRDSCLLMAGDRGQAGALRYYGAGRWMPPVASGHNSFHLWGLPPGGPWRVVVAVGLDEEALRGIFEQVELAGRHQGDPDGPIASDLLIYACRGWRVAPAEALSRLKRYI